MTTQRESGSTSEKVAPETTMPADKPRPTFADYVTIALSPALIMAMIVSLLWFLVEVLYRGEFVGRLQHVLFFFIFGMVLVARISMEAGAAERAPVYGGVLAFCTWLGMRAFVAYPPELAASSWLINAGLIGLVWWLSYRLTYSCTYLDEQAETTGAGVLHAAGLEDAPGETAASASHSLSRPNPVPTGRKEEKDDPTPLPLRTPDRRLTWWDRYWRYRDEQKKNHTPGVWVVYFALAALPIYGLGQALIEVDDIERRRATFWLMILYVASSLGLLVTTAFLGLRRYLRQRKVQMPKAITGAWLAVGGGLLVSFVFIGALLPRPAAEFSILNLTPAGSKARDASEFAAQSGEPGKGEGRPGAQERDPKGAPVDSKDSKGRGEGGKGRAKGQGSGAKTNQKFNSSDQGKQAEGSRDANGREDNQQTGEAAASRSSQRPASDGKSGSHSWLSSQPWLQKIATALKWIVFAVVAVVAVAFVLGGGLRYLANFSEWAKRLLAAWRRFWEALLGGPPGKASFQDADAETRPARRPFQAFSNPFLDGRADAMPTADLVRYSFEALEAWAQECDLGRGAVETPIEFTNRLADEAPGLEMETKRLGVLYACVLYARGTMPPDGRTAAKEFWKKLDLAPKQTPSLMLPARR